MELLIHAAAPSARKDDEKYKRQALNYAEFQCKTRVPLATAAGTQGQHDGPVESDDDRRVESYAGSDQSTASIPVYIDNTQLAISALESQIISSSLRRQGYESPHDDVGRRFNVSTASPQTPSRAPPSEPTAKGSTIGRRTEQATTPSTVSTTISRSPNLPRALGSPYVPMQEDNGLAIGYVGSNHEQQGDPSHHSNHSLIRRKNEKSTQSTPWSGDDIPSQLPSSYSLSDINSRESKDRADHTSSSGPQIGSSHSQAGHATQIHVSPQRNTERTSPSDHATSQMSSHEALDVLSQPVEEARLGPIAPTIAPDTEAGLENHKATVSVQNTISIPSSKDLATLAALPISISPKPPLTSTSLFDTHIIPGLRLLEENPQLIDRYIPSQITREIQTSERGYWSFDTRTWTFNLQIGFWRFLQVMLESGKTGWGVWCTRIIRDDDETQEFSKHPEGDAGLGVVHVYCWGQIIKHVYLMLYVASKSKIRKVGAVWVDADGQIVVRM